MVSLPDTVSTAPDNPLDGQVSGAFLQDVGLSGHTLDRVGSTVGCHRVAFRPWPSGDQTSVSAPWRSRWLRYARNRCQKTTTTASTASAPRT